MSDNGWFKLYRELIKKPIWHLSTPEQKSILITILCLANHDENKWEWMGEQFKVLPGQFVTSLESIKQSAGKGISIQNVRSSLERFKKLQFLTYQSTKAGRIVTICNWTDYQQDKKQTQQRNQQTGNKEPTINKNIRMLKEEITVNFEEFRIQYPGTKRGLEVELTDFLKQNELETINLLLPALHSEISYREKLLKQNVFVPEWKHMKTWINQKCWTQAFPDVSEPQILKSNIKQLEILSTDRKYKAI